MATSQATIARISNSFLGRLKLHTWDVKGFEGGPGHSGVSAARAVDRLGRFARGSGAKFLILAGQQAKENLQDTGDGSK